MSDSSPAKPNLTWSEGLVWCCDTLGYVTPSDRWDHVEEAMEANERRQEAVQDPPASAAVDPAKDEAK